MLLFTITSSVRNIIWVKSNRNLKISSLSEMDLDEITYHNKARLAI